MDNKKLEKELKQHIADKIQKIANDIDNFKDEEWIRTKIAKLEKKLEDWQEMNDFIHDNLKFTQTTLDSEN